MSREEQVDQLVECAMSTNHPSRAQAMRRMRHITREAVEKRQEAIKYLTSHHPRTQYYADRVSVLQSCTETLTNIKNTTRRHTWRLIAECAMDICEQDVVSACFMLVRDMANEAALSRKERHHALGTLTPTHTRSSTHTRLQRKTSNAVA